MVTLVSLYTDAFGADPQSAPVSDTKKTVILGTLTVASLGLFALLSYRPKPSPAAARLGMTEEEYQDSLEMNGPLSQVSR